MDCIAFSSYRLKWLASLSLLNTLLNLGNTFHSDCVILLERKEYNGPFVLVADVVTMKSIDI